VIEDGEHRHIDVTSYIDGVTPASPNATFPAGYVSE